MSNPQHCPVCGVKSTLKCSGCKNVVYCGKEHQKEHWRKGHKAQCKCFEIAINEQIGRYLRATRDIKKGEIILREFPILIGPKIATFPICLGCHKLVTISKDYYKCSKCTWPLCGPQCETSKYHIDECELMSEKKFVCKLNYEGENKKEAAYCVIAPLRGLLMKTKKPDVFKQFLELEDHLDDRINTKLYAVMKANLVTFVHTILGFTDLDERDILRIAAILDTNAFEIRHTQKKLRGIYLTASMMSHDCIPNSRHVFDDNMQILFIATTNIPKGGIITGSYTQILKSTLMRREHLWQAKCFNCCCKRCSDPTELGTFAGAIYCSKCKVGKIISTNPLDNQAVWKCQLCPHEIPARQISWGNAAMVKEIESLDKTTPRPFEEFILRYQDTLHERNTHILQVKYALTQLYGNVAGFYLHELTDAAVARKIELCSELIDIADLFDPDWSQFRGILILDLQEILAVQAKREYNAEMLTKEATQEKLMEAMALLKEAVEILKVEPGMQTLLQERVASLAKEIEMD